jgi:CubicO group peptidase (beta-lactamase class C family)
MALIGRLLTISFAVMLLLGALPVAADAAAPAGTLDSALVSKIEDAIQTAIKNPSNLGLAVGIVKGGQVVYTKGFGMAELGTDRAVTPQTVFLLSAIAKTATATAVMQLQAAGKLDLDAPVVKYLPYFKLASGSYQEATVRQFLLHRAGLLGSDEGEDEEHYRAPSTDDGALEKFVRSLETEDLAAPGENFKYGDLGYEILGDVVAKVSGQTYEAYVRDHVFTPLGMTHSTFGPRDVDPALLAPPHVFKPYTAQAMKLDYFPYSREHSPSIGLCSNVEDMTRYALAHLNRGKLDGAQVLPVAAYDAMWKGTPIPEGSEPEPFQGGYTDYGLGWGVSDAGGHRIVGHGGNEDGFHAGFWLAPDDGVGVVMMDNHEFASMPVEQLAYQVLQMVLGVEVGG